MTNERIGYSIGYQHLISSHLAVSVSHPSIPSPHPFVLRYSRVSQLSSSIHFASPRHQSAIHLDRKTLLLQHLRVNSLQMTRGSAMRQRLGCTIASKVTAFTSNRDGLPSPVVDALADVQRACSGVKAVDIGETLRVKDGTVGREMLV